MNRTERALAAAGAFAGIVVAYDQYFLKQKLADLLLIPVSIPTGLVALVIALISVVMLLARRGVPQLQQNLAQLESENISVREQLKNCLTLETELRTQLGRIQSELDARSSLQGKVIGILAKSEASVYDILREIGNDPNDSRHRQALFDVLGVLVQDGQVEGGSMSSNYRLVRRSR